MRWSRSYERTGWGTSARGKSGSIRAGTPTGCVWRTWCISNRRHAQRTIAAVFVYRAVTEVRELTDADRLSGDEVLPGFDIPIAALFAPTPSFPWISTSC